MGSQLQGSLALPDPGPTSDDGQSRGSSEETNKMLKIVQLQSIDVTCEMSAVTEALNMMEMNIDLYADYDFVDDVSNKPLETDRAIAARRLEK